MLVEAIAIGLVYGFLYFEGTGLVAGGLIAPGYFAVSFDQPWTIALCLATALATMLAVRAISFVTILYGRRRFIVSVLLAFALQWTLGEALVGGALARTLEVVGYVIPAWGARDGRQWGHLLSCCSVAGLLFRSRARMVARLLSPAPLRAETASGGWRPAGAWPARRWSCWSIWPRRRCGWTRTPGPRSAGLSPARRR